MPSGSCSAAARPTPEPVDATFSALHTRPVADEPRGDGDAPCRAGRLVVRRTPQPTSATSNGLARAVIVGPQQGAVHTELAVGAWLRAAGSQRHIHSFEESLYVLAGELVIEIGGAVHRLLAG